MEVLSSKSLNEINGGGKATWFIIGGIFSFVSGFVAGFVNPLVCKKK